MANCDAQVMERHRHWLLARSGESVDSTPVPQPRLGQVIVAARGAGTDCKNRWMEVSGFRNALSESGPTSSVPSWAGGFLHCPLLNTRVQRRTIRDGQDGVSRLLTD